MVVLGDAGMSKQLNPFENSSTDAGSPPPAARSDGRRFLLGFVFGASLPCLLGGYGMFQFQASVASLPPGTVVSGTPAVGSFMLIFFVAPVLGLIVGLVTLFLP